MGQGTRTHWENEANALAKRRKPILGARKSLVDGLRPDFWRDPYPIYEHLRTHWPVYRSPLRYWIVTRYDDASFVLSDKRFWQDFHSDMEARYGAEIFDVPVVRWLAKTILFQDPPAHSGLRKLIVEAFSAKRVDGIRDQVVKIARCRIEEVRARAQMDVLRDFAVPVSVTVICNILGVPESDRLRLIDQGLYFDRIIDPAPITDREIEHDNAVYLSLASYFEGLVERRVKDPGEDLISELAKAEQHSAWLDRDAVISNIVFLYAAGHESTINLIGNGLVALHRHPDQLRILKEDPALIPAAVEELLRFDSSIQLTSRVAREDLYVGGTLVKRGESVLVMLGAANRDPKAFPEPDRLDVQRSGPPPLSFGGGIHYCLGARLAKMEIEVALGVLLRELPGLRLQSVESLKWRANTVLRGITSLRAYW